MDFSQLPKMSKTPAQEEAPATAATTTQSASTSDVPRSSPPQVVYVMPDIGFGSAWISAIAGLLFLYVGQTFLRWLIATIVHRPFETGFNWLSGPNEGQPVAYFDLQGGTAYTEMGLFLMAIVLLIDAAVLGIVAARRLPSQRLLMLSLSLTGLVLLFNLGCLLWTLVQNYPLPLMTLCAVAVGGFIVFDHVSLMKRRV